MKFRNQMFIHAGLVGSASFSQAQQNGNTRITNAKLDAVYSKFANLPKPEIITPEMKALRHLAVAIGLASMAPAAAHTMTIKMANHGTKDNLPDVPSPASSPIGPVEHYDFHQLNFKNKNQRQLRKRRRQAAAAGKKNVFKKRLRGITR